MCGFYGRTLYLLSDNTTVAQCDPDGSYPCCTRSGRCGVDEGIVTVMVVLTTE